MIAEIKDKKNNRREWERIKKLINEKAQIKWKYKFSSSVYFVLS